MTNIKERKMSRMKREVVIGIAIAVVITAALGLSYQQSEQANYKEAFMTACLDTGGEVEGIDKYQFCECAYNALDKQVGIKNIKDNHYTSYKEFTTDLIELIKEETTKARIDELELAKISPKFKIEERIAQLQAELEEEV